MFDAKSILESLLKGAAPQSAPAPAATGMGGLGDILAQLQRQMGSAGSPAQSGSTSQGGQGSQGGMGGLGDILGQLQKQMGGAGGSDAQVPQTRGDTGTQSGQGGMGGLSDILGQLQKQMGGAGVGGGGLMDILGKAMGQATEGVREGAGRIGQATGANDAFGKATGGLSGDDILAKLKELVAQNQFGAGAAAGGVGAVVLGTQAGRSMAASAAKIGALALIGGLAYKAVLNYQAGRPLITGSHTLADAAPQGTGFEPQAVTNESAALYIRAMISAAAADGRVDQGEVEKITGGMKQAGIDAQAEEFLAAELNSPASIDDLVAACASPEQAVQVYTAARIAITPDSQAEVAYLSDLATALGVDTKLAAHIDAAARNAA
jgi:uncharacterized membrane protein YebE (DUF533 family)